LSPVQRNRFPTPHLAGGNHIHSCKHSVY